MGTISIAMTTYCGEKYIEKQLASLLAQRRQADEVFIFDDRSGDKTAEIVNSFIEKNGLSNWHFAVNEENLGFIRNFHKAIAACSGDIIFLCDQDDIWHDDKLEKIEKFFNEHADALSVNASFEFIDGDDKPISVPEKAGTVNHGLVFKSVGNGEAVKISEAEIVKGNISPGCTMAFSKQLKNYYLENATNLLPHDFELNIYAAKLGGLYYLNDALISYRIHSANVIGLDTSDEKIKTKFNASEQKRLKILKEQQKNVDFFRQYKTDNEEISDYIKHYCAYIDLRQACMVEHKASKWPAMWKHYSSLKPNINSRQLFGDLIYALHLQKFFKGE